jgi:transcription initiation factor TFIID subunit 11
MSVASASSAHPLRQTSFPPESQSPFPRSPSADTMSHVSGSQVSGLTAPKKKRGRKAKNTGTASKEQTPSLVGGRAPTNVSGTAGGDKEAGVDDDEDDAEETVDNIVDPNARTKEQKQEEVRLRAMLVQAFDPDQYSRYEVWRASKLADSVVKRVSEGLSLLQVPYLLMDHLFIIRLSMPQYLSLFPHTLFSPSSLLPRCLRES